MLEKYQFCEYCGPGEDGGSLSQDDLPIFLSLSVHFKYNILHGQSISLFTVSRPRSIVFMPFFFRFSGFFSTFCSLSAISPWASVFVFHYDVVFIAFLTVVVSALTIFWD